MRAKLSWVAAAVAVAVAFWTGELSSTSSSALFASAQQEEVVIIAECAEEDNARCADTANRTCYGYYEAEYTHECGYCLNGFFEYEGTCIDIETIGTDEFLLLDELLGLYLPVEYADLTDSTDERISELTSVTKVISYWNSYVPPTAFVLDLNQETFLTDDERKGRLGILSDREYRESDFLGVEGNKGKLGRFEYAYDDGSGDSDDSDDGDGGDEEGNEERRAGRKVRRLLASNTATEEGQRRLEDVPPAIDWANAGYTTIPKNQGLCGCCWAVATAGAVESALMITGQTRRYDSLDKNSLSFQQMISCDNNDLGCNGGNILQATRYVWEHNDVNNGNYGGLFSLSDYPYSDFLGETTEECNAQKKANAGKSPAAYLNYPKIVNSVNDRAGFEERKERLMAAVAQQPVISVLRAGCNLFVSYRRGVITHDEGCQCCSASCIDHAVVIVGYDANAPIPYWKLRNSWGPIWGEEGHFKIAMDDPGCGWGLFGMLAESSLPSDAYKNLSDLPERPGWWEISETWEKALVIVFSILGFCCLCGCLAGLWNKRK